MKKLFTSLTAITVSALSVFSMHSTYGQGLGVALPPHPGSKVQPVARANDITIDTVYFGQTHIHEPIHPFFRLVGEKNTLIKVHVLSKTKAKAPAVTIALQLKDESTTLILKGPKTLPDTFNKQPGKVQHRFDDCFTATIPGKWIRKGLKLTVKAGNVERSFDKLEMGPPIRLSMTMFDVHYFAYDEGADFPKNWTEEIAIRRPVTEMKVQRMKKLLFKKLLIPPGGGKPAILCSSAEDYKKQTGKRFDGEQNAALMWVKALRDAGAQDRVSLFYINIANARAGGFANLFHGCGSLRRFTVLHHELGHCLNVADLSASEEPMFPYRNEMFGVKRTSTGGYHVGPTWGYDHRINIAKTHPNTAYFISPITTHSPDNRNKLGEWRKSPVRGGASYEQGAPGTLIMYSDWSVRKMQAFLESRLLKWDADAKGFRFWHTYWCDYRKLLKNDGVKMPVEHDVKVYSIMASASAVTPDANYIYPVIGPYRSGLIKPFDPTNEADRKKARSLRGSFAKGWDVCMRVVQGGKTKTYMMPLVWNPKTNPLSGYGFQTRALNVPVSDGKVTRVELLLTPEVDIFGMPKNPKVLYARDMGEPTGEIVNTHVNFGSKPEATVKAKPVPAKPVRINLFQNLK